MEPQLYNQSAEKALIGCLFLEPELIQECTVRPEHIYSQRLKFLFSTLLNMTEKGIPINLASLSIELNENIKDAGGISYIYNVAASVKSSEDFHYYQSVVKEFATKREALKVATKIQDDVVEGEITDSLREGIQQLMMLEDNLEDTDLGDISPSLTEIYDDCETDLGEITGISSGLEQLDALTGGFQDSDFIVIGARPSVGKTAFALNLALHAAKEHVSIMFSLEMSKKQLLKRAISATAGISSIKMRNPRRNFTDEDWPKFTKAIASISKANLHLFDKGGIDMVYIWSRVQKLRREYGPNQKLLVIVDYLQLIMGDPKHRANRQAEISEISRLLKIMARELNVVVIALSQLSRGVESREDKRPILSDLRESGQIEQDADVIAFLYRDDYYEKKTPENNILEVSLAKQRNGPIGTIKLAFDKEVGRIEDVNHRDGSMISS
nr:replicative DNA helicase [Paenibacillus bovis]